MIRAPFDTLENINLLIAMRKGYHDGRKWKCTELASHFNCSYDRVIDTLSFHKVRINQLPRKPLGDGKYDYLFDEPIAKGMNYKEYVVKHKVHVPKSYFGSDRLGKTGKDPWRVKKNHQ